MSYVQIFKVKWISLDDALAHCDKTSRSYLMLWLVSWISQIDRADDSWKLDPTRTHHQWRLGISIQHQYKTF